MEKLRIQGGRTLSGQVRVGGAKNAALPELVATLLTEEPVRLTNVPAVRDVATIVRLLEHLGVAIERDNDKTRAQLSAFNGTEAPYDLVKTMRASFLVLGPLLARTGRARVSLPGGCAIGARPVDQHLSALARLGADLRVEEGYVVAEAQRLRGADVTFDSPTVGGTEHLMLAASLADGTTVLRNAAREPEVVDLAALLNAMGAEVEGAGSDTVVIRGASELGGADHEILPDRIEAGTYLIAGALKGDRLEVTKCRPTDFEAVIDKVQEIGADVEIGDDFLRVSAASDYRGIDARTQPHPGFPTDMQAQYMALMTQATGSALVTETIFENRFMHVPELNRMGADITVDGHTAIVRGPRQLGGARVMATDLRASASLVLAGLAAEGETIIDRLYHLDRGYESLVEKLGAAGAEVERFRE
ncbi:MAG: UDP-N-acetylglucosamine 1-carboxyvinyltransferase [Acidobacteria bacterium]|nr:UDP-N-acetylglucosamine 1-carboxyvinyltransferase [Acidobacteriota bacterium]